MTLEVRYTKFCNTFPKSGLTFADWKKMSSWAHTSPTLLRLDLSIFSDALRSIEYNDSALNTIVMCDTQTELENIDLACTSLNRLLIPSELTKVKSVDVSCTPMVKFNPGGSAATLETLRLSDRMLNARYKVPSDMVNLKTLAVGSVNGQVFLPKDLASLEELIVEVSNDAENKKLSIPAGMDKLKVLKVIGAKTMAIAGGGDSIEKLTMNLHSNDADECISIPRLNNCKELMVTTGQVAPIAIPGSIGKTVEKLNVYSCRADVKLGTSMPNVTELEVYPSREGVVTVPADTEKLVRVGISSSAVIKSSLPNLESIRVNGKKVTIKNLASAVNLRDISMPMVESLIGQFPDDLPKLERLIVGPAVTTDKINHPETTIVKPAMVMEF